MNAKGALLALLAFAIYATHDAVIKFLGASYSPFQIIFFSSLLAFPMVTFLLMRDATQANLRPVHPWWTGLRTICGVITGVCAFYAFSVLPLAETYALLFAQPLIITVLSIPVLGEKVGAHRWGAVVVGLIGVVIVLRPGGQALELGHIAGVAAAAFGALGAIIIRKIGGEERAVVLMLYPLAANFLLMIAVLPFVYEPMPLLDLGGVGVIALFSLTAGLILIMAYKNAEAAIVAPMQYSQIIWATVFGFLFFGESLDGPTVLGAAVIIASGMYIVFRESAGPSTNTPVLRTKSRGYSPSGFRIGAIVRLRREKERREAQ
ncbi:EamA-like transporter family protein [Aquimixticola soesokkakensis]|uniref:EamA-like transporter family protein n=2 Tax=Aquimixticola soesokkakensis TaxID=1519096 RepID=A0A1Y5RCP4_9RHOB|nr:EamA-like transporter family protein [Aquimixticola soesokkakensis]